jgi:hypothetical protein
VLLLMVNVIGLLVSRCCGASQLRGSESGDESPRSKCWRGSWDAADPETAHHATGSAAPRREFAPLDSFRISAFGFRISAAQPASREPRKIRAAEEAGVVPQFL